MKTPPALLVRVRLALAGQTGIVEKPMFGSIGFMRHGHLLAGVRAERAMFRIPPALHEAALREPGVSTVVMRGKPLVGYVHVTAQALSTEARLQHWLGLALGHNATLPAR